LAEPAPAGEPESLKLIVPETPPTVIDLAAQQEAGEFAQKQLTRDDRLRGHVHWATVLMVWAFVGSMLAMGGAWLFHLITPWTFLSPAQLDKLQTLLLASLGSSLVSEQAKKLGPKK
jgi:hypothetical protein